jgi:hypothetical protein
VALPFANPNTEPVCIDYPVRRSSLVYNALSEQNQLGSKEETHQLLMYVDVTIGRKIVNIS